MSQPNCGVEKKIRVRGPWREAEGGKSCNCLPLTRGSSCFSFTAFVFHRGGPDAPGPCQTVTISLMKKGFLSRAQLEGEREDRPVLPSPERDEKGR